MADAVTGSCRAAITADGGCLGDVTSVALSGTSQRVRAILEGFFVEAMTCDGQPSALGRTFGQASGDRVLIVRASEVWALSVEVLLALLCWPEGEAVGLLPEKAGEGDFILLVRKEAGSQAVKAWSSKASPSEEGQHRGPGQDDLRTWIDSMTPEWVCLEDLGIAS